MTLSGIGKRLRPHTRKWLFTACCLAVFAAGHAAVKGIEPSVGDSADTLTSLKVFAELPLEVTEMIRPSTRLDMIDYYTQADSLLTAVNALGGESRIEEVAPDYMRVSVTPVSTLEIKLLQSGRRPVVMTLYTTGDQEAARDTEVRFFDAELRPLETLKFLKPPKLTDYFTLNGSGISEKELMEKIPYMAVEYTTGPGEAPLKATLTTVEVISQEDRDQLIPILVPALSAQWKGQYRFK